jgi:hypothetical protein
MCLVALSVRRTDGESYFANVKRIIDNDHIEVVFGACGRGGVLGAERPPPSTCWRWRPLRHADNDDIETINLQVTRVKRYSSALATVTGGRRLSRPA